MFCPKCHTELEDNTETCRRCGTKIDSKSKKHLWGSFSSTKTFERMSVKEEEKETEQIEELDINLDDHNEEHQEQYNYSKEYSNVEKDKPEEHHEQYNYSEKYSNTSQEQVTSDQDYIDAYMGTKYTSNLPFSIPTIILGPFYYLYKKMYSIGIIILILYVASYIYLDEDLSLTLRLIMNVILAIKFKQKYKEDVEKKVQIIKNRNPNSTSTELLEKCKKEGTSLNLGILIMIIILYFASIATLIVNNPETKETKKQSDTKDYSVDKLHYKIPDGIEEKDEYSNYQFFKDKKEKGSCYISVYVQSINMTEKEFLVTLSSSYNQFKQSDIETVDINNNKFSSRVFESSDRKIEIYVMKEKNNTIYELDFEEQPNFSDACKEDKEYIFNSLEIK